MSRPTLVWGEIIVKSLLFRGLVLVVVLSLGTENCWARPGGGGGRRGGGAGGGRPASPGTPGNARTPSPNANPGLPSLPAGGSIVTNGPANGAPVSPKANDRERTSGNASDRQQQLDQFLNGKNPSAQDRREGQRNDAASLYAPENEPFSPAWYADHPNAWRATHPHADAYAAATAATLGSWLALAAVPTTTTVVASGTVPAESQEEQTATDVNEIADAGNAAVDSTTEWMQIGVYTLHQSPALEPTRMLQLDVSKEGQIRGTYYDLVSEDVQNLKGSVDKTSQKVAWRIGDQGNVVFESNLKALTETSSAVTVHFANGKTAKWELVQTER
ncbi:MAG: hypothetical protein U1D30_18935 [Planctomycetota bacterium]